MEIRQNAFAFALAKTSAVLYALCALVVAIWPEGAMQLLGSVAHLVSVDKFAGDVQLTLGSFVIGLIEIVIYSYFAGWLFAWFYSRAK